jgi:hypothetical protein
MAERYIILKCQRCGATVDVYEDSQVLACNSCRVQLKVERTHGTIALRAVNGQSESSQSSTAELNITRLQGEQKALTHELAKGRARKIAMGVVGLGCGVLFAYVGAASLLAKDFLVGGSLLVCTAGSLWFVRFVLQDISKTADTIRRRVNNIRIHLAVPDGIGATSDLEVARVAFDLYFGEILFYPSWSQCAPGYVPARVTEAIKGAFGTVKLTLSGSEYLFTLQREDGNVAGESARLDLSVNSSQVLSVSAVVSEDQWITHTSSHSLRAFVNGPWVQELLTLATEAKECRRGQTMLRHPVSQTLRE